MGYHVVRFAVIVALASCARRNDRDGVDPSAARSSAGRAAPAATGTATATGVAMPPGALAKFRPTMTMAEATKIAPDLRGRDSARGKALLDGALLVGVYDDTPFGVTLRIDVPPARAQQLTSSWGPGEKADMAGGGEEARVWFNPDAGIRTRMFLRDTDRMELLFERYVPVATLLGPGPKLPFLVDDFQTKTSQQLRGSSPLLIIDDEGDLFVPATEWTLDVHGLLLVKRPSGPDKPIASLELAIPFQTPEHQAHIMRAIEAKWGKARGPSAVRRDAVVYHEDPHIAVTPGNDAVRIYIGTKP